MNQAQTLNARRLGFTAVACAVSMFVAGCGGGGGDAAAQDVAAAPTPPISSDTGTPAPATPPAPGAESPATGNQPPATGNESPATPAPPPPTGTPAPAPTEPPPPAPAPAPPPAGTVQAEANRSYTVPADATQAYNLRLPANSQLRVGDTIAVAGSTAAGWRITQQEQQYVVTTGLPGNIVPGSQWTPVSVDPAQPAQDWVSTATSSDGNLLVAASRNGGIHISRDGGATWQRSSAPAASWGELAMSPDGTHIAAAERTGLIYTSSDGGATWSARSTPRRYWGGVYISADGRLIVATETGGSIHRSTDGGATFSAVPGTANTDWRRIAGSRSGDRLVAVASFYAGDATRRGVYVSTDGGITWTPRATNSSEPPTGNWSFAASSEDGMRMAAIDNGGYPWISSDGGATWQMRFSYSNWTDIAVSGDGNVVSALEPRDDSRGYTGYVFVSPDGGGSTWNWFGENRWYQGVSLSFDGNNILVADAGPGGSGGLLYTSRGNRTSIGSNGALAATQAASIELRYEGSGRFVVVRQSGGPFTIR